MEEVTTKRDVSKAAEKEFRNSQVPYAILHIMQQVSHITQWFKGCFVNFFEKEAMKQFLTFGILERKYYFWPEEQTLDGTKSLPSMGESSDDSPQKINVA